MNALPDGYEVSSVGGPRTPRTALKVMPGLTCANGLEAGIGSDGPSCRVVWLEQAPRRIITAASIVDFKAFIGLPPIPASGSGLRLRQEIPSGLRKSPKPQLEPLQTAICGR